jgi:hypothetical protein
VARAGKKGMQESKRELSEAAKGFGLGGNAFHRLANLTPTCPECHFQGKWFGPVYNLLESDGTAIPLESNYDKSKPQSTYTLRLSSFEEIKITLPDGAQIQCKRCMRTWPFFAEQTLRQRVVEIIETHRSQTSLGSDNYPMINAGPGSMARRINLEQAWSQSWSIEYEKAIRTAMVAEISAGKAGGLKNEIETQVRTKYAATETLSRTYTDELTVHVDPNSKVVVTINWKKIWQHGLLKLSDGGEVPFKVAVQLTYDFSKDVVEA